MRGVRDGVGRERHLTFVAFAHKYNDILCFNLIFGVMRLYLTLKYSHKEFLQEVF